MFATDAELINAMVDGREAAFRHAIATYHNAMLALARSFVGDKLADEVAQEAWVSVMRAASLRTALQPEDLAHAHRGERGADPAAQRKPTGIT
jgi:DNA-directed RNA polymerase specialized sigma24 family protein